MSPITNDDIGNVLPPNLQLEIAIHRWNRISTIMRKKDIKKFAWNLKVQIQVLKHPTVSIQRFGGLSLLVKSLGVDLIDNNCYLLSPVPIQDAIDLCIVAWVLWPDEEKGSNPSIEKVTLISRNDQLEHIIIYTFVLIEFIAVIVIHSAAFVFLCVRSMKYCHKLSVN